MFFGLHINSASNKHHMHLLLQSWVSSLEANFVYTEIFKAVYSTKESEIFKPTSLTDKINAHTFYVFGCFFQMPIFNEYSLGNVGKFEITLNKLKGNAGTCCKIRNWNCSLFSGTQGLQNWALGGSVSCTEHSKKQELRYKYTPSTPHFLLKSEC